MSHKNVQFRSSLPKLSVDESSLHLNDTWILHDCRGQVHVNEYTKVTKTLNSAEAQPVFELAETEAIISLGHYVSLYYRN